MSAELASTIVSNVLVYAIYGCCVLLVVLMAKLSLLEARMDVELRAWRARQAIEAIEASWPQYVIEEQP